LAPGPWFNSVEPEEYRRRYLAQLARLDPHEVLSDLLELAGECVPVMVCFEPPQAGSKWCHRGLISAWFGDEIGLEVFEYGLWHEGAGWRHPKLHPSFRQLPQPSTQLQAGSGVMDQQVTRPVKRGETVAAPMVESIDESKDEPKDESKDEPKDDKRLSERPGPEEEVSSRRRPKKPKTKPQQEEFSF
jgi:hypothetical protein